MLRSVKEMRGYVLEAEDGEIGRCKDFLFDDQLWTIRYMVADTGKWLPGRKVLLSPIALENPDWRTKRFPVKLTVRQIEESPPLDQDAPVSRQYEKKWFQHYGWSYYWSGPNMWGFEPYPTHLYVRRREELESDETRPEETHLRSVNEVTGYHIQATDGEVGHVEDFIVDDEAWAIRYLVVDTRNWLPGRQVLLAPTWMKKVDWVERKVEVGRSKSEVEASPEYDPHAPVNREYETVLYDFYGQPHYWK